QLSYVRFPVKDVQIKLMYVGPQLMYVRFAVMVVQIKSIYVATLLMYVRNDEMQLEPRRQVRFSASFMLQGSRSWVSGDVRSHPWYVRRGTTIGERTAASLGRVRSAPAQCV